MSALIRAVLSASSVELRPGEKADLTLNIQNFGEIVDRYKISVEGVDPSWVSLSRSEISLFPKDQDQVRLIVQLPPGPEARAGRYDVRIQVTSQENPAERTTVPLELVVAGQVTLELALHPQQQSGLNEGLFTIQVSNPGNRDLTIQLAATDPEEGCVYLFNPPQFVLPAGQSRVAQMLVRPRVKLPSTQAKVFPFTVTARPVEDAKLARQVQGQWQKTAVQKRKVWPYIVGGLAALLVLAAALILLLRGCGRSVEIPFVPTDTPRPAVTSYLAGPTDTPRPTYTSVPSQPTHTPVPTVPTATPTMPIPSIGGTWIGQLVEKTGDQRTFVSVILIAHEAGSSTFTGHIYTYYHSALLSDRDLIEGTFDGRNFRVRDEEGRHYWGTIHGGRALDGEVAWNCYDCASWGTLQYTGPWDGGYTGAWAGQLVETSGSLRTFSALLIIEQRAGSNTFGGRISFYREGQREEVYGLQEGSVIGDGIRFSEGGGRHFWGKVGLGKFDGQVAWSCYDCPSWGTLHLEQAGFTLPILRPFVTLRPVRP